MELTELVSQIERAKVSLRAAGFRGSASLLQTMREILDTCGADIGPLIDGVAEVATMKIPDGELKEIEKQVVKTEIGMALLIALAQDRY